MCQRWRPHWWRFLNAYADLGQTWAARRTAREVLKEETSTTAALRIAIADVLEVSGDDAGALELIVSLGDAAQSAGALKVSACAAHDMGRADKRAAALEALSHLIEASPQEALGAYVCTGENERAAAVLAVMVKKPDMRTSAILTVQLYADGAKAGTDLNDLRYRLKALAASAAVQDAIRPYARTMALPFTTANARIN